jgi:hypothetical protein
MKPRRAITEQLFDLAGAIAGNEATKIAKLLRENPSLVQAQASEGATRQSASRFWFPDIGYYLLKGDTPLHIAAAAKKRTLVKTLLARGADVHARNRHGQQPLHYACVALPGGLAWNPRNQAEVVRLLLEGGADPNAVDARGVAPLHRAARTRCASVVKVLLDYGASPELRNRSGNTAHRLAEMTTGRGGSGSFDAKAQQRLIRALLDAAR